MSAVARSTVQGCPSSLLNDPGGATTSPSGASTAATRSLVDVLPDDPVIPTMVSPPATSSAATARASLASAASTAAPDPSASCSSTPASASAASTGGATMAGTPTGRAASTATAPAATADSAWSCPSVRAPGSARNNPPGPTARESNSTVPVTRRRAASGAVMSARVPPTMSAIWATVRSIIPAPFEARRPRAAPRPAPPGRRTGGCARRCAARSHDPCPRPAPRRPVPPRQRRGGSPHAGRRSR